MYENLNIGNEIRYFRIKRNLSQEKLAEKSNLSLNFISKLETGRISNISLNKLLNICNALNIPLGKLVGDDIAKSFSELPPSTIELIKVMSKLNYSKLEQISRDLIPLIKDFD
ncbi:helix-turn-helix domain-containing protein [Ligilactobacillus araffinosus]|uniref:helix-turn-helix domain-containing protein n=1 Tax=Ligilactobacillus araffinosus TaxID=147809 RepID=UPI000708A807|nr:helix-turn-helix transcriptional regulator [Ligilactobacillus araffinosus]